MTFNDETKKAPQEGPNQLSHLFYRHDLNDRDNHDQRHGRAGAAEAQVTAQSETMSKPRLLDCFCGGGGAGYGYHLAGFEVVGVDIEPQKNYPFEFYQVDALEFIAAHGHEYDVIHTSPPCQGYSELNRLHKKEYPLLISDVRNLLIASGKPYIIENVAGAKDHLINPMVLCGIHFGLKVYRHRFFEVNPFLLGLPHIPHNDQTPAVGRGTSPKGYISITGTGGFGIPDGFKYACKAIGIDWMSRPELSQAIPPAYTRWIGERLLEALAA